MFRIKVGNRTYRKLRKIYFRYERFYCKVDNSEDKKNPRFNPLNIQMLSPSLHSQIFKNSSQIKQESIKKSIDHLKHHHLWGKETSVLPDIELKLPKLFGNNIDEHFQYLGNRFSSEYRKLLEILIHTELPEKPQKWEFIKGWVRYSNGKVESVDYPLESALVFDVEICLKDAPYPTLATAVSNKAWYCWCSERLVNEQFSWSKGITVADLIPLEIQENVKASGKKDWSEKIVIGHNVMFDRAFVKEQYFIQGTKLRFLDTLSLHMCVSGLTSTQRAMSVAYKSKKKDNSENDLSPLMWLDISSLNNLADVYSLYNEGEQINKDPKNIFITGTLNDIRENFQELVSYCANDVFATYKILQKLLPIFYSRFPHPVTLAAMLEMSTAYLPVNYNWIRYIEDSQTTYNNLQHELKLSLIHLADDNCDLLNNQRYKKDPWMWDLDWSVQELKFCKTISKEKKNQKSLKSQSDNFTNEVSDDELLLVEKIQDILQTANYLPKIRPFLPGYPLWYRELCEKPKKDGKHDEWIFGPVLISTQIRSVPKLLRLIWDNFPLHYDKKHGWGYLVPDLCGPVEIYSENRDNMFPIKELLEKIIFKAVQLPNVEHVTSAEFENIWKKVVEPKESYRERELQWSLILGKDLTKNIVFHHGNGPFDDDCIQGCRFFRLPHKDGPHKRVGNPLSKDFLIKISDGTLQAYDSGYAEKALKFSKMISYWKNSHKRIESQMIVSLNKNELPRAITRNEKYEEENMYGAILPRLIIAGTVTRRAVEQTWLTASNAYPDRVGSELKSMIQSPPGYHFVGADVDSQELWIASLLGDSHFTGIHGCTAFGWMTLQGKKSNATDMHSRTALSVGITREQAKIINYGRIYGAGQPFAQQLLMQFNHHLTPEDAKQKAKKMYTETKGIRKLVNEFEDDNDEQDIILRNKFKKRKWIGGSESHMFNKLEEIAQSSEPRTPVLGCRISKALEPETVDKNFMTSRINWVVQSSAVDYLHLMLVCMKWLIEEYGINGRFSISIHDEVRYLVQSEDRYRAALALQITNLLTRAMFAHKVGMNDLPQSTAFFSSVDIDTVIRKEVDMDCKTPSNPHGLERGYGIPPGESLDIYNIIKKTNGSLKN
ncbi:DNA polymerase subunit gamma-1 isoform X1 [Centruroides vittatus]|uniref:DNA polymerase subunit gamma-1 isoform X1 n=1 Tax=Centruroides vittatus TaxID=120091 RepID=UPI0035105D4D